MATPSRRLAFRILGEVENGLLLSDALAHPEVEALPPRDRAFLQELTLGTLRAQGALDSALTPLIRRPLSRLDPAIRRSLRLGAYQLLRMRVPARAAVSESVDLARTAAPAGAGLVNAVLRRLAREGPPAAADPEREPLAWLTTEGSLPPWLAKRWLKALGPARAVARARAFAAAPPTVVRLNPRVADAASRLEAAGVTLRPTAVPEAFEASGRVTDLARAGVVYVQDAGAQAVARLAAVTGIVLDACAAPGGKSLLLADLAGDDGRVVAAEVSPRRLQTLRRVVERWGAANVRLVGADARAAPFRGTFDSILLDAPCSGLGTLGRNPDARWRPIDLERHASRQRELLEAMAPFARRGGRLVYATCSLEPEENEDVVRAFLDAHRDFAAEELPAWAARFADGSFARTLPERDGGDGFFAAVLRRA
ncbi:MAG TPA: 16S rRNA (cytosine(967)-C(5))-methyltransferase RsmB [Vicinamibacteria bacterium]